MKKKPRNKSTSKSAKLRNTSTLERVCEPDDPNCDPTAKWSIQFRYLELSDLYDIEIRFFKRSGKRDRLIISAGDRSEFDKIRRDLCAHDARLPTDKKLALEFVQKLISATPTKAITVVWKPGIRNGAKGLVMPMRMYGTAEKRFIWDAGSSDPAFGEIKGDLLQYRKSVLEPALLSPYVSFAILIALAAPLPSYVEQKDGRGKLLPEGAIYHFAGESSSGKTTLARVTQSVFGSPDITTDYEATARGVAEAAYSRNDLVMVLDDTESVGLPDKELLSLMRLLAQRIPSGRSKAIAKWAGKRSYPPLKWSCFCVSTGPETMAKIASRVGSKRFGERVRFLEIEVPPNAQGGIFKTSLIGAKQETNDPDRLIGQIERGLSENHGVLFDAWGSFLLSADHSARVRSLVDKFVEMTAGGENALEKRFARKFGVMYAAGEIAVKAGLLPWPPDWPFKVVQQCYWLSRNIRDPDAGAIEAGLMAIAQALKCKGRFLRHDASERKLLSFTESALGLRLSKGGKSRYYICPNRLELLGVKDSKIRQLIIEKAKELGLIVASKNASSSVQLRIKTPEGHVKKFRFWRLRRDRTLAWAAKREKARAK
jgi:hypothetical protein